MNLLPFTQVRCSALAFSNPHACSVLSPDFRRQRTSRRRPRRPAPQALATQRSGSHAFLDVERSARGASAHGLRRSGRRGDPEQVAEDVHGQRGQRQRRELNDRPRLARQAHRPARAIGCARPARAGRTPTTDRLIDDAVPHKPNTARLSCGAGQSRGMQCGLSVLFRAPPLSQCGAAPARNRSPLPFTRECAAPEKR